MRRVKLGAAAAREELEAEKESRQAAEARAEANAIAAEQMSTVANSSEELLRKLSVESDTLKQVLFGQRLRTLAVEKSKLAYEEEGTASDRGARGEHTPNRRARGTDRWSSRRDCWHQLSAEQRRRAHSTTRARVGGGATPA